LIRRATVDDVPALVEMGGRFIASSAYRGRIGDNADVRRGLMKRMIDGPEFALLVSVRSGTLTGMIGMMTYEHPLSGDLVAGEVFWWAEDGRGLSLLRAAEAWARGKGVTAVQMIAPNDRVGAIYEAKGYRPLERIYQRELR
jgi:hypothetical protein